MFKNKGIVVLLIFKFEWKFEYKLLVLKDLVFVVWSWINLCKSSKELIEELSIIGIRYICFSSFSCKIHHPHPAALWAWYDATKIKCTISLISTT